MKAISLRQPYASLIAGGAKPYETRAYPPPKSLIGETIAIHAAMKRTRETIILAEDLIYGRHGDELMNTLLATYSECPNDLMGVFGETVMPIGCVVCTAKLDAAFELGELDDDAEISVIRVRSRMTSGIINGISAVKHDHFGNYSPGRWAWLLTDIKPLNPPVKAVGRQRIFNLPQGWMVET